MYSREGPGIAVGDINGDGLDDFFVGGSTSFPGMFFIQEPNGLFTSKQLEDNYNYEDMGALFFDVDNDSDEDLFIVSGGTGLPPGNPYYANRIYLNQGNGQFERIENALPEDLICGSQVTSSDYDKDGDLDLFICGRVDLENYPLPPRSYILQNNSDESQVRFTDVTESYCSDLLRPGLATSALWSDFNLDGWMDLILCGDWMSIRLYQNMNGSFLDVTETSGLGEYTGWWNSLVSADFDKDGDPDYIAGNFGLNTRFKVSATQPMQIVAKDFDHNGILDPVSSSFINDVRYPIHNRQQMLSQIPMLSNQFKNFEDYARADLQSIISESMMKNAYTADCKYFNSAYIENLGNGIFEVHTLPIEAQFAPVFGILANDFDGDGNCDVLLAGNSFSSTVEDGRQDAFTGLLLSGDGQGQFEPVLSRESGFYVDGDAKGMAELYSDDGYSLILSAENSGELRVFRNIRTGRRIMRLNKNDASAELRYMDGSTEYREFFYGQGYLSHSSRVCEIPDKVISVKITTFTDETRQIHINQ